MDPVLQWVIGLTFPLVAGGLIGLTAFLFKLRERVVILERDSLNGGKGVINQRIATLEQEVKNLREWKHDVVEPSFRKLGEQIYDRKRRDR